MNSTAHPSKKGGAINQKGGQEKKNAEGNILGDAGHGESRKRIESEKVGP